MRPASEALLQLAPGAHPRLRRARVRLGALFRVSHQRGGPPASELAAALDLVDHLLRHRTQRRVITSQRLGQAPSDLLRARLGGRRVRVVHRHLGKVVGQPVHELPAHVRRQMLPALGAAIFEQCAGVAIQVAEHRRPRGQERDHCVAAAGIRIRLGGGVDHNG